MLTLLILSAIEPLISLKVLTNWSNLATWFLPFRCGAQRALQQLRPNLCSTSRPYGPMRAHSTLEYNLDYAKMMMT